MYNNYVLSIVFSPIKIVNKVKQRHRVIEEDSNDSFVVASCGEEEETEENDQVMLFNTGNFKYSDLAVLDSFLNRVCRYCSLSVQVVSRFIICKKTTLVMPDMVCFWLAFLAYLIVNPRFWEWIPSWKYEFLSWLF